MNFAALSAEDRRTFILGIVIAVAALISFLDPSGNWGAVMVLAILAGLAAIWLPIQPQVSPAMKMPVAKSMAILIAGAVATGASGLALLSYIGYVFRNLTDVYELIVIAGFVASIILLYFGWLAWKAEGGSLNMGAASSTPTAGPPPTAASADDVPAETPDEPPAAPPAS